MDLFPTLLEEYDLSGAPGLDYLKKHIKENGKNNEHSLAVNGVSSHGGWDPLDDENCRPIMDVLHECLTDYNHKIGNYPAIVSGSWYNILPKGGYTDRHRHESSVISGAFYLQLPEGDHGQFYVVSPLKPYMMCIHNIQPTPYGVYEIDIPIKENHLYLFPSWLEHGSRVNNTDGDRITMSFNTSACPREMLPDEFLESVWDLGCEEMRVVDTLPLKLGAVLYPEHQKVKSLMIEEINNHGIDYEHKKVDAYAKGLEHFDYYSPLSDDKYKEFREWIQIQAEIYARDILNYDTSDFILTDSWLNVCDSGGRQSAHYHINAVICALYYVNFDDEVHAPTYFYRPNNSMNYPNYFAYMLTNQKETKYNHINEVIGVEGSLLRYSNTCHGYTTNYGNNRITVSSNLMPRYINEVRIEPLTKDERHTAMTTSRSGKLWDYPLL